MILQKDYKTYLTVELSNISEWEIQIDLWDVVDSDIWFILIEPNSINQESIFFHRRVWASVFCYWINRSNPITHLENSQVLVVNSIDYMNYLLDQTNRQLYIYKKSLQHIICVGWVFYDNWKNITLSNLDTELALENKTLTSNATNYLYIYNEDFYITTTPITEEAYLIATIVVWVWWNINTLTRHNTFVVWNKWVKWDSASVELWTVLTWAAWSSVEITNSWDEQNVILNFVIPEWDKWDQWDPWEELQIRVNAWYIQTKYETELVWTNLIALTSLTWAAWKSVELQKSDTHIQWRLVWDVTWINLVELSTLKWANAPQLQIQYSINWSTLWHFPFVTWDFYQRISTDWWLTWSWAIKFVWEDGIWSWDLLSTNNLSDLANTETARQNLWLEIWVDVLAQRTFWDIVDSDIADFAPALWVDDNYVTDAELTKLQSWVQAIETTTSEYQRNIICRARTTANIASLSWTMTVDWVELIAWDYILVANQTTASQNWVYQVNDWDWTRAIEYDETIELYKHDIFIVEWTTYKKTWWLCATKNETVWTTSLLFAQIPNWIWTAADQAAAWNHSHKAINFTWLASMWASVAHRYTSRTATASTGTTDNIVRFSWSTAEQIETLPDWVDVANNSWRIITYVNNATVNWTIRQFTSNTLDWSASDFILRPWYFKVVMNTAVDTWITVSYWRINDTIDLEVADEAYWAWWDGSLEVPTKNALYNKIENLWWWSISWLTDNTFFVWENISANNSLFIEQSPTFAQATSAQNIWELINSNWRVSFAIFGSWISWHTTKLSLSKAWTPTANLWFRIETDNSWVPSWTLADINSYWTIAAASLTTSLADTTITFNWSFTLTKWIKYHLVLFQWTYWSETISSSNYYNIWYSTNHTSIRPTNTLLLWAINNFNPNIPYTSTTTAERWCRIYANTNHAIKKVTRISTCTATRCRITTDWWTVLWTATFSWDVATFSPTVNLTAWNYYKIMADNSGWSYTFSEYACTYPKNFTDFNLISRNDWNTFFIWNISSVEVEKLTYTSSNTKFIYTLWNIIQNEILSKTSASYSYKIDRYWISNEAKNTWEKPILSIWWKHDWLSNIIHWSTYYLSNTEWEISTSAWTNSKIIWKWVWQTWLMLKANFAW